ncbi:methyltransferase domain-containing protein [Candidatus Woesearchaeota archaeon]|nr:methyltransferase domain-containing protein [Candidatus Woesearchaeota archaeon]
MEQQHILTAYNSGARTYETVMRKYWHIDRKEFIGSLGIKPGFNVLEAAVGTGLDLPYFCRGVSVVGIDITPGMLEVAREKKGEAQIQLEEMDVHSMTFSDSYFDGAVSTFTLCVVKDPRKALEEMLRVTKPGSKMAILDYCKSRNQDIVKWQELIAYHAANVGFPKETIVWNSLMDYDRLLYHSGLPITVESDERYESDNPFSTACKIVLRNDK